MVMYTYKIENSENDWYTYWKRLLELKINFFSYLQETVYWEKYYHAHLSLRKHFLLDLLHKIKWNSIKMLNSKSYHHICDQRNLVVGKYKMIRNAKAKKLLYKLK